MLHLNFKFHSREIIVDIAAHIGVNLLRSGSRLLPFCGRLAAVNLMRSNETAASLMLSGSSF